MDAIQLRPYLSPEDYYRQKNISYKSPRMCLFSWTEKQKLHKIFCPCVSNKTHIYFVHSHYER